MGKQKQTDVIVFWLADTSPFASMVAWYLLNEGIQTVNRGRLGSHLPLFFGVANQRQKPIFSTQVSRRGLICARRPKLTNSSCVDYLLTVSSGVEVDALRAPRALLPVLDLRELTESLDRFPATKGSQIELSVALPQLAAPSIQCTRRQDKNIDVSEIAELAIGLVTKLTDGSCVF